MFYRILQYVVPVAVLLAALMTAINMPNALGLLLGIAGVAVSVGLILRSPYKEL